MKIKHIQYSICLVLSLSISATVRTQTKLYTKSATIQFFSKTKLENIEATNNKVLCVWIPGSGDIEFAVLMKGFVFKKALMQEHFNDEYVESDKYPKATFKGKMEGSSNISFNVDRIYNVKVKGILNMHGISNEVTTNAVITIRQGVISGEANFTISLSDYKIKIPSIVATNVSNQINIQVTIPAFQSL